METVVIQSERFPIFLLTKLGQDVVDMNGYVSVPGLPRYYRFSKPILVSLDHWAGMHLTVNSCLECIIVDTIAFKEILTNNYKLQDLFELSIRNTIL